MEPSAFYVDGSSATVTSNASWSVNCSNYASISSGKLTTKSVSSDQECIIAASYEGESDTDYVTIKNHVVPTISNVASKLYLLNDPNCNLYGTPVGTSFLVTFDYSDPNGDGPTNISEAKMDISWKFQYGSISGFSDYTWHSSLSGNGYSGTATTKQCYIFYSNNYVDVTMTIEDLSGAKSNQLPIRIYKPSGSN